MKKLLILIVVILVAAGGVYFYTSSLENQVEETAEQNDAQTAIDAEEQAVEEVAAADFDLDAALEDRILGDVNAPIRISEHSSFTCGHCAHFHKTAFADVKAALIDTGKAYIVFTDFPLNAPALHASMIARCIPQKDRYFDFVQMLFEQQEEWAHDGNYLNILKTKAADYGLDSAGYKACLENEDLQKGIVAGAKAAQTQWNVSSTPSFVVNNKTLISGAIPADAFIAQVEAAAAAAVVAQGVQEEASSTEEEILPELPEAAQPKNTVPEILETPEATADEAPEEEPAAEPSSSRWSTSPATEEPAEAGAE